MLNAVGLQNPGVEKVDRRGAAQAERVLSQKGDRQRQRLLRGGVRRRPAQLLDREEQVGLAGGEHQLPQCPRRAACRFGTSPERCRRSHPGGEGGDQKAGIYEAQPQCHRHRVHRQGLRGRGGRRHQPDQYPDGHAAWTLKTRQSRPGQQHRRHVRPGHLPPGGADGLSGVSGGVHPHHRHGGRHLRPRT